MSKFISEVSGLNLHLPKNMEKTQKTDLWYLRSWKILITGCCNKNIVSNDAKNMYMYIISYPQYKYWNNMNDLDILSL